MEMMPNPYENKLNQEALEEQRKKYIQQEISWLLSDEGLVWLKHFIELDDVEYDGEAGEDGRTDIIYGIISKISMRLWEKNPGKNKEEDYAKFKAEFSDEIIKKQLIAEEIIDEHDNITVFSGNEE